MAKVKHVNAEQIKADQDLIARLNGPTAVANALGYKPQRVQNWLVRGIPAGERWNHREYFQSKEIEVSA